MNDKMELRELQPFVIMIILIGMVLAVGLLTLDKLGTAAKDSTIVTNETVVFLNGAGSTANDDVTSVTYVGNGTADCTVFNTALWCANWTTAGAITMNDSTFAGPLVNGSYNVSYVYDADSTTTTVTANTNSALSAIASNWLTLIITIVALAIILTLVIRSFSNRGR